MRVVEGGKTLELDVELIPFCQAGEKWVSGTVARERVKKSGPEPNSKMGELLRKNQRLIPERGVIIVFFDWHDVGWHGENFATCLHLLKDGDMMFSTVNIKTCPDLNKYDEKGYPGSQEKDESMFFPWYMAVRVKVRA